MVAHVALTTETVMVMLMVAITTHIRMMMMLAMMMMMIVLVVLMAAHAGNIMLMSVVALRRAHATRNHTQNNASTQRNRRRNLRAMRRIPVFTDRRIDLATAAWALVVPSAPPAPRTAAAAWQYHALCRAHIARLYPPNLQATPTTEPSKHKAACAKRIHM